MKTNTYSLTKPNGEVYAMVTCEDGMLKIKMNTYYGVMVHLDEKIIPQLLDALQGISREKTKM
jgi:hypothetical protein